MSKLAKLCVCLITFTLFAVNARAQGIFATLTGVVSDPAGAVLAGSKVTLRDAESGSLRQTTANGEGYFTFASVPVGTYILTAEATGFELYKADDIRLGVVRVAMSISP